MDADLHLHTTASDGSLTPRQLVEKAKEVGFSAIAVTDHDSVGGIAEALEWGGKLGIEVIPGIELSTLRGGKEVHILGYFIDWQNSELNNWLKKFISARKDRAAKTVEKLNQLGYSIELARVKEIAGKEFIGRPHIALALQEKGYIKEIKEAFTKELIANGGRAYVERYKITPEAAIAAVHKYKGIAVLAHPGYLPDATALPEEDIRFLVQEGLDGIEVYYSKHIPQQTEYCQKIAEKYHLLITGGSDYHGEKSGLKIKLGPVKVGEELVEKLRLASNKGKNG